MSINLTGSAKLSTLNPIKILEAKHYGPYFDAVDGALLRDKKASDAIKASMSPMVNKTLELNQDPQINIKNWKVNFDIEFNKAENSDIKEDFNKIKEQIDYSKMSIYSKDKLEEVITNLKNRRNWINAISNLENQGLKNELKH